MKNTTLGSLKLGVASLLVLGSVKAAVVVQTTGWSDGDVGAVPTTNSAVVPFDITTANSILIATVYIDNNLIYAASGINEIMPRPGLCRVAT